MKLIAIDLDGTLLNANEEVSNKSKEYLTSLKKDGNIIVINTGRILSSALRVTDGALFANYIVSSNGGVVYDVENKKVIFEEKILQEDIINICKLYNDNLKSIEFSDLNYYNIYEKNERNHSSSYKKINSLEEFLDEKHNIFNIAISSESKLYISNLYGYIKDNFENLNPIMVHSAYSDNVYIEISKKGITKYTGLCYIANIYDIKNDDIIAFGDSENDLNMVIKSGIGVAMSNAVDELKQVADFITLSNNENGVVAFLEKIIK